MALRKDIETGSGAHASYWKVQGIRLVVVGYVDEEKRRAGKDSLANSHVDIPAEEIQELLPLLYKRLGQVKEFAGCEDT